MWGLAYWLTKHRPNLFLKKGRGPNWRFNRRTGMITKFHYDKEYAVVPPTLEEHPFIHFDAYLGQVMISGNMIYHLVLCNRYTSTVIVPGISGSNNDVAAYWDF